MGKFLCLSQVFSSTAKKIREGKNDEFRKIYQNSIPIIFASKTTTLVQFAHAGEADEFTVICLFLYAEVPDSAISGSF